MAIVLEWDGKELGFRKSKVAFIWRKKHLSIYIPPGASRKYTDMGPSHMYDREDMGQTNLV